MNRIVIVYDHPAFRAWARAVLAADGFRIAGEAADAASALAEVQAVRPDVVLLDVLSHRPIRGTGCHGGHDLVLLSSTGHYRRRADVQADAVHHDLLCACSGQPAGPVPVRQ